MTINACKGHGDEHLPGAGSRNRTLLHFEHVWSTCLSRCDGKHVLGKM
jgi:hypothetical protein